MEKPCPVAGLFGDVLIGKHEYKKDNRGRISLSLKNYISLERKCEQSRRRFQCNYKIKKF
jgi:hypothetical protein